MAGEEGEGIMIHGGGADDPPQESGARRGSLPSSRLLATAGTPLLRAETLVEVPCLIPCQKPFPATIELVMASVPLHAIPAPLVEAALAEMVQLFSERWFELKIPPPLPLLRFSATVHCSMRKEPPLKIPPP